MMAAPKRVFPVEIDPKGPFPLLVGIEGPPGGGKSLSALRLAAGIQRVRKGPIVVIDTEAGRSRMYHAQIPFSLVKFDPPFRPGDFLDAVQQQVAADPAAIIVDSLSDEHEGTGGVLEWHEEEIDRRLKPEERNDWRRRDALAMAGWIRPKADRVRMVNGFLRILVPLIFTFRAREKTKPIKGADGKTVPTKIGYQAVAPAEVVHAMTLMCLLPPHADGVPVWRSESAGEDFLLKWPNFLQSATGTGQLNEDIGERLALWAAGGSGNVTHSRTTIESGAQPALPPKTPAGESPSAPLPPAKEADAPAGHEIDESERLVRVEVELREAAEGGYRPLAARWKLLSDQDTITFLSMRDRMLVPRAREVDREKTPPTPGAPVQRADLLL